MMKIAYQGLAGRVSLFGIAAGLLLAVPAVSAKSIKAEKPAKSGGYRFTETFLAGGPDAPEESQFFERMGSISVDADAKGNVYVLDNGNYRVQVFSPAGKFVRSIGREGEGPGEMKLPMHMAVNGAGQVAVYDLATRRATVFKADGTVRNDLIIDGMIQGLLLRDDGTLVVSFDYESPVSQEAFDASGKSIWKLSMRPEKKNDNEKVVRIGPGLVAPPVAGTGSGNVYGVLADAYSVGQISPAGRLVMDFTRTYERQKPKAPPKIGEGGKDGPRMIMIKETDGGPGGEGGGDGGGMKREVKVGKHGDEGGVDWNDLAKYMPEFTSDLRGILLWPDGRVWAVTSKVDGEAMISDEWDAAGGYQRVFSIPDRYRWLRVGSDGKLYAVARDEEDYPMVYRLDVAAVN